jgi:23S rRNA pseudouridine1911/1915/1917 synthase
MRKERKYRDDLEVIFEDQWLIVVNKPSGLLSMSTGKAGEDTAYSRVYDYAGKIFIVHRLDRDTSGLLVFAKDQETKTALQENWDKAVKERGYTALLEGRIEDEDGWIETWLHENKKSMKVHCYGLAPQDNPDKPPRKEWQFAATHCHTVKHVDIDGRTYTLVDFELETGRKNQIRVHSQWIGHPVAGDRKYGADTNPIGRLALHARALAFIHPWTGKTMRFTSRLPKSFRLQH